MEDQKRQKCDRSVAIIPILILMFVLLIVFICVDRDYNDIQKKSIQWIKGFIKNSNILKLSYSNAKEVLPQTAYSFLFAIYAILGSSLVFMWNRSEAKIYGIEVKDSVSFVWNFLCKIVLIWMAVLPLLTLWFQNCGYVLSAYWMIIISFFLALFQFYLTSNTFKGEKRFELMENGLYLQLQSLDAAAIYNGENEGGNLRYYIYTLCFNIYRQQGYKDVAGIYMNILNRMIRKQEERTEYLYKIFVFSYEYSCQVLAVFQQQKEKTRIHLAAFLLQNFQKELENQDFSAKREKNKKKYAFAYIGLLFGFYSAEYLDIIDSHIRWMSHIITNTGDDGTGKKGFLETLAFYLTVMVEVALTDSRNEDGRFLQIFDDNDKCGSTLWFNMKLFDPAVLDEPILKKMETYAHIDYISCLKKIERDITEDGNGHSSRFRILLIRGAE